VFSIHQEECQKILGCTLSIEKYGILHMSVVSIEGYENDHQDATVYDNLLFLGCSPCFERYFSSSSGASKLYYSFWYYTRMLLPAGIVGVLELFQHSHDTSQQ
jgi:hypothetical protein